MKKAWIPLLALALSIWFLWPKSAPPGVAHVSAPLPAEPVARSLPARPAAPPVASPWPQIDARTHQLHSLSQGELDKLYSDAGRVIRADQEKMGRYLVDSVPELTHRPLIEALFSLSAWNRFGASPSRLTSALFEYRPPADQMPTGSSHLAAPTAYDQLLKLQAYSVRDLRNQLNGGTAKVDSEERARLVALLAPRAGTEKSLNISLEIFQLLNLWHEKEAIDAALQMRSPADQELIRGVLGT